MVVKKILGAELEWSSGLEWWALKPGWFPGLRECSTMMEEPGSASRFPPGWFPVYGLSHDNLLEEAFYSP